MNHAELFQRLKDAQRVTTEVAKSWQHYKGGVYSILCIAINEKTLNPEVVYASEAGIIWTRSLESFLSTVVMDDGTNLPRFKALS